MHIALKRHFSSHSRPHGQQRPSPARGAHQAVTTGIFAPYVALLAMFPLAAALFLAKDSSLTNPPKDKDHPPPEGVTVVKTESEEGIHETVVPDHGVIKHPGAVVDRK